MGQNPSWNLSGKDEQSASMSDEEQVSDLDDPLEELKSRIEEGEGESLPQ